MAPERAQETPQRPFSPLAEGPRVLAAHAPDPERVEVRSPTWPYSAVVNLAMTLLLGVALSLPFAGAGGPGVHVAILVVPILLATLLTRVSFDSAAAEPNRMGDAWGRTRAALVASAVGIGLVLLSGVVAGASISWAGTVAAAVGVPFSLEMAARLRTLELRLRAGARRIFFIGSGEQLQELEWEAGRRGDMQVVGFSPVSRNGLPRLDGSQLVDRVLESRATMLVMASEAIRDETMVAAASEINFRGRRVRALNHFYEDEFAKVPLSELSNSWFLFDVAEIHSPRLYGAAKRALESVFAAVLLLLSLPLWPLLALAVRLSSPGPVFFRQERVGRDGHTFVLTKFRTMYVDRAEVTPVGRRLRRFRLDELPQLWAVVRGHLSLVGPRPEQPGIVDQLRKDMEFYVARHCVRPGLTGWAQVNHVWEPREKLQYDFFYIKNQGLLLDLMIIAWTVRTIVTGSGR